MTTDKETNVKLDEMLKRISAAHEAAGTSRRCPTCNAGVGKWCVGLAAPQTHAARR